jgi:hypothetical protein
MKTRHLVFFFFLLIFSELSIPFSAQAKTIYRCESFRRVDGTSGFRVNPSITGSFGLFNPASVSQNCFVPVTKKRCSYKGPASGNKWYKCGRTPALDRGDFDFSQGIGEIVEDNNGKKYHAFSSVVQFTFE